MNNYEIIVAADGAQTYLINGEEVDAQTFTTTQQQDPFLIAAAAAAQVKAERQALLEAPIVPLPIEGSTVEDIKDSATAAIADLVEQMTARLALLGGSNA